VRDVTCPLDGDELHKKVQKMELEQFFEDERQKQLAPGLFNYEDGDQAQLLDYAKQILRKCMEDAFNRCVSRTDPYEVLVMLEITRQLQKLGEEDPLLTTFMEGSLVERCLRFELDFESKIVLEDTSRNAGGTTRLKYRSAHVPLRFSYGGNFYALRSIWEGGCSLLPEVATLELPYSLGDCTLTVDPGKGWFTVEAAWIGVMDDPTKSAVRVLYNPGDPQVKTTLTCDEQPVDLPVQQFAAEYLFLHENEFSDMFGDPVYMANNWEQLRFGPGPSQNGEFFAKKSYERGPIVWRPDLTLTEETWFFLKHTPDKPMPECP
jgi:hypothetical protein